MSDVVIEDTVSDQVRSEGRSLVAQIMCDVDSPSQNNKGINIKDQAIIELVLEILEELFENKDLIVQLVDIRSIGGYLFAHSVNCAVLTSLMAVKLNSYDQASLKKITLGALLHDLGMVTIPESIIDKNNALTIDEYEMVKQHPVYGYELFKKSSLFNIKSGKMILQHHERNQGQGYPGGLKGSELDKMVHLLMIADVFDALTSDKPNREAYQTHQAVEMLMSRGGELFDLELLRHFISNIAAYPAGTHVCLNNGESGFVVGNTPGYALRPVVRIYYKGQDLAAHPKPYDLDLKQALDLTIVKVLDNNIATGT